MSILNDIKYRRLPARSIDDLLIPDEAWKPDIEIADRYQSYATELMRVSLLGFAGFGFLISEVVMKEYDTYCGVVFGLKFWEIIALSSLMIALALALSHRFLSTSCIYYQVLIGRSLIRNKNEKGAWTEEDLRAEAEYLKQARAAQRKKSTHSNLVLKASAGFLIIGYIGLSFIFYAFINKFESKAPKAAGIRSEVSPAGGTYVAQTAGKDSVRHNPQ